jgi:hypothetical protein
MGNFPFDNGASRPATLVGRDNTHTDLPTGEVVAIHQNIGEVSTNLKILQEPLLPEWEMEYQP